MATPHTRRMSPAALTTLREALAEGVLRERIEDAVFVWDREGRLVFLNLAARPLVGLGEEGDPASLSTKGVILEFFCDGRPLSPAESPVTRALDGETTNGEQMRLRRPDGLFYELTITSGPLAAPGGEVCGAFLIGRESGRQSDAELRGVSTELAACRNDTASAMAAISHGLRSPLTKIFGFANLLERKYHERLEGMGVEYLQWIKANAQRMDDRLDGLLQMLQIDQKEMSIEEVDLSATAAAILQDLRENGPERMIELRIEAGLRGVGDSSLLQTALRHLLENAWKFTGRKKIARIEFYVGQIEDHPIYHVRDNGAGFNMDQAYRLFLPFERLHAENDFPGVGIGLALVKKIIERHGGKVFVEAEEGQGATFSFTLG